MPYPSGNHPLYRGRGKSFPVPFSMVGDNMNVYLFGFTKKENSTKTPLITDGVQFSCQLKDETSVLRPEMIILNTNQQGQPIQPTIYNYAYIPLFMRYYFISDWQYINGAWVCYCNVDVLASHKLQIGTTSCYIERSASSYDGNIIDTMYPATTDVQITSATIANSWSGVAPSGGCYILGVINYQSSNHIGAISYYAMDTSGLNSLLNYLFSSNIYNAGSITEIGEDLFKSLFNPFQYIVSCMWFPGSPSIYGSTSTNIKVGYWATNVYAVMVNAITDVRFVTGTIPDHPQISRGAYLNYEPYTKITLYCPPFGSIPIDTFYTKVGKYLYAKVSIDVATGEATINVSFRPNTSAGYQAKSCCTKTGMMGVPIQLAQVLSDYSGSVSSLTSGLTSGSIVGAVMGGITATVQSAISSQTPKVSTSGSNGSFNTFTIAPELVVEHYKIANEDLADLGRPLMQTKTLNTLSGYVKCAEAHFSGNCYDEETAKINNYLVSGFFYE